MKPRRLLPLRGAEVSSSRALHPAALATHVRDHDREPEPSWKSEEPASAQQEAPSPVAALPGGVDVLGVDFNRIPPRDAECEGSHSSRIAPRRTTASQSRAATVGPEARSES